jgi:DNA polymerase-3 subunit gamma/tau
MLGLAERGRVTALLGHILEADATATLGALAEAHEAGVEPDTLFAALLDAVHAITTARLSGTDDEALGEGDRALIRGWAETLGFPVLHRLWQLLLKGHQEIGIAPDPRQAADMAALRLVHAAGLPDPSTLAGLAPTGSAGTSASAPAPAPSAAGPVDFAGVVALAEQAKEALLAKTLRDDVACVVLAPGRLRLAATGRLPAGFERLLADRLADWTGQPWEVALEAAPEATSLRQQEVAADAIARAEALADPAVAALLAAFPGAELQSVTR